MPPLLPPAAEALTVTVPAPVIVTRSPAIVAGPDAIAKLTGRPDDEVAVDRERRITERLRAQREERNRLFHRQRRSRRQRDAADQDVGERRRLQRVRGRHLRPVLDVARLQHDRARRRDRGERAPGAIRHRRAARPHADRERRGGRDVGDPLDVLPVDAGRGIEHAREERPRARIRRRPDRVDDNGAAEGVEVAGGHRPHRRRNRDRVATPPAHRRPK